ncbi:MAG: N-acetyltransferase family protein [Lachnospirales bacterium]
MKNTIFNEEDINIRVATLDDAQNILNIYGYYVEHSSLTFEYEVPTVSEFKNRMSKTLEMYPYLVAELNNEIVGYAYAGRFQTRAAYAWNAEMSIYLKKDICRKGIGRKLYCLLEDILKEQHIIKTIAHITLPVDEYSDFNSMQFHKSMGYSLVGKIDYLGYKFGRWYTGTYMDKLIGVPSDNVPDICSFNEVRNKFGL